MKISTAEIGAPQVRPFQVRISQKSPCTFSVMKVGPRKDRSRQVSAGENGLIEKRTSKVCASEVCSSQVGSSQVRFRQERLVQIGPLQVSHTQVGFSEICGMKIAQSEIGSV